MSRLFMPDEPPPEHWQSGDVIVMQHGPNPGNLFALQTVTLTDSGSIGESRWAQDEITSYARALYIGRFVARNLML